MRKGNRFVKGLSIAGTICVLFPILMALAFSLVRLITNHDFLFDYLLPAELGLVVLFGAGLLLWAAIRSKYYRKSVIWVISIVLFCLVASQGIAVITGLASGKIGMGGWQFILVMSLLGIYDLTVFLLGVIGIKLIKKVFQT